MIVTTLPSTLTTGGLYQIQAGTTITISSSVTGNNVTIEKIGTGVNPKILLTNGAGINLTGASILHDIDVETTAIADYAIMISGTSTVDGCDVKGGDPGIFLGTGTNLTIQNCHVHGTYYDTIMTLATVTVLNIIDCVFDDCYFEDNANDICKLGYDGGGSQDIIHVESVATLNLTRVIADHTQTRGKFALIFNKFNIVNALDCIFVAHAAGTAVFAGSQTGSKAIFTNCQFLGGTQGIWNNTEIECYNCLFKGQTDYGVFQGLNKKFEDTTFEDCGAGFRAWDNMTTLTRVLFKNCTSKWASSAQYITDNSHSTDPASGYGCDIVSTYVVRPTPPLVNYKGLYETTDGLRIQAESDVTTLTEENATLNQSLDEYRAMKLEVYRRATTRGNTFANLAKYLVSLNLD